MKIGFMNSPFRLLPDEFAFAAENNFDYLELTLEPPLASVDDLQPARVRELMAETGMTLPVGHSAWYLPYGNPLAEISEACLPYCRKCLAFYHSLGIGLMSVHTNFVYSEKFMDPVMEHHLSFLPRLVDLAGEFGITIMLEPMERPQDTEENIARLLDEVGGLTLLLDLGHAHIVQKDGGCGLIERYRDRLLHVHLSDNNGLRDQHLPLGEGTVDLHRALGCLKAAGYDGTVTLEVFVDDRTELLKSRELFRRIWSGLP